jgi:transposase
MGHAGCVGMSKPLLPDDLWNRIEPLLPTVPVNPKGGRPRIPDRACLTGILFVLKTGIPWESLPVEMGCGCGMTCWRRVRDWQEAGVWDRLHRTLLDALGGAGQIDGERACAESVRRRRVAPSGPTVSKCWRAMTAPIWREKIPAITKMGAGMDRAAAGCRYMGVRWAS